MARITHRMDMHRSDAGTAGKLDAEHILIEDAGGYFSSTDVEGALQEIGAGGGGGGGGLTISWMETPTGTINGTNDDFDLAHTPTANTLMLFKNGLLQRPGSGNDYTISGVTVTFEAGNIPNTGDILVATYPH